jgi:hypothetical protein
MLRSVFTRPSGTQVGGTPAFITGQESPLKDRWGGWYVTGSDGNQLHMGNVVMSTTGSSDPIGDQLDTSAYLTKTSDIVAHLVLAHQTQMHNLITQTNYQTRLALYKPPVDPDKFERPAEQLVRYLLFANEARLEDRVVGTSGFAEEFAAKGPRDSHGRSLRDFDLRTRIFKYPCSYLIYSDAFDAIPEPAKSYIYRRLFEVLSGREQGPEYAALSKEDRRAILEILVETKLGLPEEWKRFVKESNL